MKYYLIIIGLVVLGVVYGNLDADEVARPDTVMSPAPETHVTGEDWSLSLALQPGSIQGNSTYHINFPGGESELEFPLKHSLFGLTCVLTYGENQTDDQLRSRLSISWFTSLSSNAGHMKDSDWIDNDIALFTDLGLPVPGNEHPGKDIYSESQAELKASLTDVNYAISLNAASRQGGMNTGLVAGYQTQRFEYDISNTAQVGYGPYAPYFTGNVPGPVLVYRITYKIPYLGLRTEFLLDKHIQGKIGLGFSGWVQADDVDDHLLRYKVGKGDCQGSAFMFSLGFQWMFKPQCALQVFYTHMSIDTQGTQIQEWYGNDPASPGVDDTGDWVSVDDKITATMSTSYFGIGYKF